jgi:hypothetical protein
MEHAAIAVAQILASRIHAPCEQRCVAKDKLDIPEKLFTSPETYFLYGQTIRSAWPLLYLPQIETSSVDCELSANDGSPLTEEMEEIISRLDEKCWFHYVRFSDGTDLIRWTGLFDFLVSSDGRRIIGRSFLDNPHERFQSYLLGQVLSFAMLRQGIEPLHATVVVIKGQAVALLGDSGIGKSTLAAAFLGAGFPILTDDMLIVKKIGDRYFAYPGPPRIKLFPEMAQALLAGDVTGTPMNPNTTKLIIPLSSQEVVQSPVELKGFYALQPPEAHTREVMINRLSQGKALLALVQNTYNTVVKSPDRLTRQFNYAAELSNHFAVKSLTYPRELSSLPKVIYEVMKDIA